MKITKNFIITLSVTLLVLGTIVTIIILLNKKTKPKPGPKPGPGPGPKPDPGPGPGPKPDPGPGPGPGPGPKPGPGPGPKPDKCDGKIFRCNNNKGICELVKNPKESKYFLFDNENECNKVCVKTTGNSVNDFDDCTNGKGCKNETTTCLKHSEYYYQCMTKNDKLPNGISSICNVNSGGGSGGGGNDPGCKTPFKTLNNSNIDLDLKAPASKTMANYCACNACIPPEGPDKTQTLPNGKKINCLTRLPKKDGENFNRGKAEAGPYGHMCPRMMMGSPIMLEAHEKDLKENPNLKDYNYAVVGHDRIDNKTILLNGKELDPDTPEEACGECYEIIFEDENDNIKKDPNTNNGIPLMKPLIVQSFNTAAPSGTNVINFDLYMPLGGYGAFNAVYKDAYFDNTTHSDSFMYKSQPMKISETGEKGSFGLLEGGARGSSIFNSGDNQDSPYENGCETGKDLCKRDSIEYNYGPFCKDDKGKIVDCWKTNCDDKISGVLFKNQCLTANNYKQICNEIVGNDDKQTSLVRSACEWVFNNNYHWNSGIKKVRRVQCPKNLMLATGLKKTNTKLPIAGEKSDRGWITSADVRNPPPGKSKPQTWAIGTTTMEDGCKPTCSNVFAVKGADKEYNAMYTCDNNGNVFVDDS